MLHYTSDSAGKQGPCKGKRVRGKDKIRQHVLTVMVAITFDSESQPCLSESKRQINIVIHNFKLNWSCFYSLCVLFWPIPSAIRVTTATKSIAGEISELTAVPASPFCFFLQNGQAVRQWSKTYKKTAVINQHDKTPD